MRGTRLICYSALNGMLRNGTRACGRHFSICLVGILLLLACNPSERRKAHRAADRASEKALQLSRKAKEEAQAVSADVRSGIKSNSTDEAEAKLRNGGHELAKAGALAAGKLDRAAIVARIKTKLASDVGIDTVSGVNVEVAGQNVRLSGTIASAEQKQAAGQAALEIPGVLNVQNDLHVAQ